MITTVQPSKKGWMTMNRLFVSNENNTMKENKAAIAWTAQLNTATGTIAKQLFDGFVTEAADDEHKAEHLQLAMKENDILDQLLIGHTTIESEDFEWLKAASEDELDRMLKSQQSKRSRTKKMEMTQDNFMKLVNAAAAEIIIRKVAHKEKNAVDVVKLNGCELTDEMIEHFKEDQEALKKAIRNVQSKKTALKKKGLEGGEQWQELVEFEVALKDLRVGGVRTTTVIKEVAVVPEEVKEQLSKIDDAKQLFMDVEAIDKLKANDAKELLKKLAVALGINE